MKLSKTIAGMAMIASMAAAPLAAESVKPVEPTVSTQAAAPVLGTLTAVHIGDIVLVLYGCAPHAGGTAVSTSTTNRGLSTALGVCL